MKYYFKVFIGSFSQIIFFGILLFGPARTLSWPEAIVLVSFYSILQVICISYMAIYAPRSLESRMSNSIPGTGLDRIATPLLWLSLITWMVVNPIDVFYLNVFSPPTAELKYLGLFLFVLGYLLILLTMIQNEFAAPTVLTSNEQKVIDSGLYSIIRHPMYSSLAIWCLGISLWLESYLGCILIIILVPPVLFRIYIEENELINELDGYLEYTKKVKYRLIPYLF